jgi:hypothetical protein
MATHTFHLVVDNKLSLPTPCCWSKANFSFDPRYLSKQPCSCPSCGKTWEVTMLPISVNPDDMHVRPNWRRTSKRKSEV